jgi:CTP synthase
MFEEQGVRRLVMKSLGLGEAEVDLAEWRGIVERTRAPSHEVNIAMVGKYMDVPDAYMSVTEALHHGGVANDARVNINYLESDELEGDRTEEVLADADGIVVPGGFGERGLEGKINAITHARTHGVPFLGLCLGLQCAVVEYARNVCGLEGAASKEYQEDTPHPVVIFLKEQEYATELGGTQRLGEYPCQLEPGSLAHRLYGQDTVGERHRHRYEVNNEYRETLADHGMVFSGTSPKGDLVEIVELPGHPYFIASQFHPEFKSRPNRPHPFFEGLVKASLDRKAVAKKVTAVEAT